MGTHLEDPVEVVREHLMRHRRDVAEVGGPDWLGDVLDLLILEAPLVPPSTIDADMVPDYIYPH